MISQTNANDRRGVVAEGAVESDHQRVTILQLQAGIGAGIPRASRQERLPRSGELVEALRPKLRLRGAHLG